MPGVVHGKRRVPRVLIGLVLLALVGCGIGLTLAWPRLFPDPLMHGLRAYDRSDWSAAARSAREVLQTRGGDPAALRLLARSSVRMGRDDVALAIYTRRLDKEAVQPEDDLLRGVALKRRGQGDQALQVWEKALEAERVPAGILDELIYHFCEEGGRAGILEHLERHPIDQAARAAERLRQQPGWQSRGDLTLGTIRIATHDVPGAAESFRRVLRRDPKEIDNSREPTQLRKSIARTFLRVGQPAEARETLQSIPAHRADPEASWLLGRAYLQEGDKARGPGGDGPRRVVPQGNPLEEEPSPYVGEARCRQCHPTIFRDSLASRHTRTYYRRAQLRSLPRPDRPLTDPPTPRSPTRSRKLTALSGMRHESATPCCDSVIEYAFGTSDRYLTMVGRDAGDRYRIVRLSYHHTTAGGGWDRTILNAGEPTRTEDFRGRPISVCDGVIKCLYCHVTFPRGARADRPGDGRPRHRVRAVPRPRGESSRGGRGRLPRPGDRQPRLRFAPGGHGEAVQRLPHPRPELPARRPREPLLDPLARSRLDLEPVQHRERRIVRMRHLPRSPPRRPGDHDRAIRGEVPRLPLGAAAQPPGVPGPPARVTAEAGSASAL